VSGGQVTLDGSLSAGPTVSGDGGFPASSCSAPLSLSVVPKPYLAACPVLSQTIASPSAYVTLPCIGAGGPVVNADTIYVKCDGPCALRLTFDDGTGAGTTFTSVVPLQGAFLCEPPSQSVSGVGGFCTKVELQGSATVEYYASGQR